MRGAVKKCLVDACAWAGAGPGATRALAARALDGRSSRVNGKSGVAREARAAKSAACGLIEKKKGKRFR